MSEASNKISELANYLAELNYAAVKSSLAVLLEIANKCTTFDEFKICLAATVKNLKEGDKK